MSITSKSNKGRINVTHKKSPFIGIGKSFRTKIDPVKEYEIVEDNEDIKNDISELSYNERKENMKKLKKDIKGGVGDSQQSTHFTITFRSYDDKAEFLESIGINGDDTIITSDKFVKRLYDN